MYKTKGGSMKVSVSSGYEYTGKGESPAESFNLEVEGEVVDAPEAVAETYLQLRKILRKGIGKED